MGFGDWSLASYLTEREKSPLFFRLGRARKLPWTPRALSKASASRPLRSRWNHLLGVEKSKRERMRRAGEGERGMNSPVFHQDETLRILPPQNFTQKSLKAHQVLHRLHGPPNSGSDTHVYEHRTRRQMARANKPAGIKHHKGNPRITFDTIILDRARSHVQPPVTNC